MISPFLGFVTTADAEQGSNASWAGVIILLDIAYVIKSYAPRLPAGIYYIIAGGWKGGNMGVADGNIRTTLIANFSNAVPPEAPLLPESVNLSPVQYKYDLSGNRIKTIKKQ